jgi:hypothetical protein
VWWYTPVITRGQLELHNEILAQENKQTKKKKLAYFPLLKILVEHNFPKVYVNRVAYVYNFKVNKYTQTYIQIKDQIKFVDHEQKPSVDRLISNYCTLR